MKVICFFLYFLLLGLAISAMTATDIICGLFAGWLVDFTSKIRQHNHLLFRRISKTYPVNGLPRILFVASKLLIFLSRAIQCFVAVRGETRNRRLYIFLDVCYTFLKVLRFRFIWMIEGNPQKKETSKMTVRNLCCLNPYIK